MADLSAAIAPDSTEYGDRQTLEAGLAQVGGGGVGGAPPSPTTVVPEVDDPFGDMLSGAINPDGNPLTSGLSVGPGPGPSLAPTSPTDNDLGNKLKMIAEQTTSPVLRRAAVARLRRMYRGVDRE